MMKDTYRECCDLLVIAVVVLWQTPSLATALGALVASRVRFALVIAAASTLREVGATAAALAIYRRERKRCDRRMAVVRARRAHFTSAHDEA